MPQSLLFVESYILIDAVGTPFECIALAIQSKRNVTCEHVSLLPVKILSHCIKKVRANERIEIINFVDI